MAIVLLQHLIDYAKSQQWNDDYITALQYIIELLNQ